MKSLLNLAICNTQNTVPRQLPTKVKSRMQGLDAHKYRSTVHCISEILKNEGPMAFYKGVGPRLTRVCCEVGITMSIYGEIVKVVSLVQI